ncbi:MAG: hypothetical protein AAGG48_02015 [Planctomycetota bacterium]
MSTNSSAYSVPQMRAETGYEDDGAIAPVRISGFLCLVLGLLSFVSLFGKPLLVIPVAAFFVGLIALRKYVGEERPVGTTAAKLGMVIAVGFGSCGLFVHTFKGRTLGAQAEKFALDYVEVIASGNDFYALELEKDYPNRFSDSMDLEEHYALDDIGENIVGQFRRRQVNEVIRTRGPGSVWALDESVTVQYSYGKERARVVLRDPTGETTSKILIFLLYRVDSKGNGQWHVEDCSIVSERLIAPAVL